MLDGRPTAEGKGRGGDKAIQANGRYKLRSGERVRGDKARLGPWV